ncbi:MAG: peptide deformylase [Candidatus Kerfeldbacteria bacterium]|nr:peptide deformylase [Candidatus Kerfeldbacteria bacterium]
MAKLTIITNPHPTLRKKAARIPIEEIPSLRKFADDMVTTMYHANGIGLAAPQVDRSICLIVVSTKDGALKLFNPEIIKKSFRKEEGEEGCLSIPGLYGIVKRHKTITVKAYQENAHLVTVKASGLFARVLQHEIDHINGILFIDRTKKIMTGNEAEPSENL